MPIVTINRWAKENPATSRGEIKETEIEIFPNSAYLENQFIKVDVNPPLVPNQYKYVPVIENGRVTPSQFDAGVTFDGITASAKEILSLGFAIGPKMDILINYCEVPNAWFDFYNGKIEVCKGGATDADVPTHEYGHADLFFQLPLLDGNGPDGNAVAYHEYYADVAAATTAKNWKIGEYAAIAFGMDESGKYNGIRDILAKVVKWKEAKRTDDPHLRSLAFSGVAARMWQRLTRSAGRFKLSEDTAFLLMRALTRNQPNFLPKPNDLSPQEFYWSLAGSLNGLYVSGRLKKIITAHSPATTPLAGRQPSLHGGEGVDIDAWASYLHMAIRQECVRTGLVSESEVVKGAVKIKDRPEGVSEENVPSRVFSFYGGIRRTFQQTTRLIFKKDGNFVKSEDVIVVGYNITEYIFDGGTPVKFFNGAKKLGGIDLEVEIGPGMMQNYIPPSNAALMLVSELQSGDKLKKAIEKKVPITAQMRPAEQNRRTGIRNMLFARVSQSLRAANPANLKHTLALIDGKNNVQYRFNLGIISAYVDLRTGEVDFAVNAFIE